LRNKNTPIKKAGSILLKTLLSAILLLILLWTIFQIGVVQNYAATKVTAYLSEELKTKVEVSKVKFRLLKYLKFEEIYVEDLQADTLLAVRSLEVDLLNLSLKGSNLAIAAKVEQPILNIHRHQGDSVFNYQFLLNYFNQDRKSSSTSFSFESKEMMILDGAFSYHDYNIPDTIPRMNYSHVEVENIGLTACDLSFKNGTTKADIQSLSLNSRNGFDLFNLKSRIEISSEQMIFNDLAIRTMATDLKADLTFTANDYQSYQRFNQEVFISFDFQETILDLSDLAYFVPSMSDAHHQVSLDGKVSGTVDNLSSDKFALTLNRESYLIGEFDIRGLPDLEETFIFFNASKLRFNAQRINDLPIRSFKPNFRFQPPTLLKRLGDVDFEGNFTGYLNDFVAYGRFITPLGNFKTDLSFREEKRKFFYEGSVASKQFDLGGILNTEDFGGIGFKLELDGKGIDPEKLEAKAVGQINSLVYKDYEYNGISLNGTFSAKKFNGELSIRDEHLALDFNGSVNADTSKLITNFDLNLIEAQLANLNLFNKEDSLTTLSFKASFDASGSQLDDFNGSIKVDSINYADKNYSYQGDNMLLAASRSGNQRRLNLSSSFLDAEIKGEYKLNELLKYLESELYRQVPNRTYDSKGLANQRFTYRLNVRNFDPLSQIFVPGLSLDSSTSINGFFDDENRLNSLKLNSDYIGFQRFQFRGLKLNANSDQKGIKVDIGAEEFNLASTLKLKEFAFITQLDSGIMDAITTWEAVNDRSENGQLKMQAKVDSINGLSGRLSDSYFLLNDSLWQFNAANRFAWRGKSFLVDSLRLGNASQAVLLNGQISEDPQDSLRLNLTDFDLSYLSTFIDSEELEMKGRINGKAVLKDTYRQRVITSDLKINKLVINQVKINEAALESFWLKDSTGIAVNAYLGMRKDPLLSLNGRLDPRSLRDNLDLNLDFSAFPVSITEPFIDHIISDIKGELNGRVVIKGKLNEPLLNGDVKLSEAQMRVNYLNTLYRLDHKILIRPDFIGFNLMDIVDENGKIATATGTIFHQNYRNFNLDIGIEMNDFLALNTSAKDNELFYGKGIASGRTNISGYADQLIFEMNLTAKEGTDFKIPLKDDVSLSENDFLVFTNSPQYEEDSTYEIDLSGIQLNFDLRIEPEAKTTIIFDPSIGDVITAKGTGNLKLEINTLGNFNMFGQYELEKGNYLFTLRNVVNKRFQLSPGSRMMWDGDPYQARLDIEAIYNLRASLYDLMPEDSTGRYRRRVPVELILDLGGFLLNPEINFDIRIPDSDEIIQNRLQSILYVNESNVNEQELNQQVFGLLVLNRFMPPSSGSNQSTASRGAPGMNNAYELLSNQLSSWLSSVSNDFDVGVSYRPADDVSQEELDVSLSTEILNDRLVLDGNFGYIADNQNLSTERASNFIGEFMVEYKLKRDGRLRLRGFNRSNTNDLIQLNSPYTQGVGLFYREEFNNFSEIWRKYFGKDKRENKDPDATSDRSDRNAIRKEQAEDHLVKEDQ